ENSQYLFFWTSSLVRTTPRVSSPVSRRRNDPVGKSSQSAEPGKAQPEKAADPGTSSKCQIGATPYSRQQPSPSDTPVVKVLSPGACRPRSTAIAVRTHAGASN